MTVENCAVFPAVSGASYISLSDTMSKINHRLYRMTRKYHCDVKIHNPDKNLALDVYVLNNTWMLDKAVAYARQAYEKAVKEEKKLLGKQLARWHDFRLNLNPSDGSNTTFTALNPLAVNMDTLTTQALTAGDFQLSIARDEDTNVSYKFGLWESGSQFNILKEYSRSGSTEDSPDDIETIAPYDAIDDEAQSSTFAELQTQGNEPPYDKDNMNDARLFRHVGALVTTQGGRQKLSTGTFCAPLGLVVLVPRQGVDYPVSDAQVCIHVKKGNYKGLASEAMS